MSNAHTTARFTWPERGLLAVCAIGALITAGLLAGDLVAGDWTAAQTRFTPLGLDLLIAWCVCLTADLRDARRRLRIRERLGRETVR